MRLENLYENFGKASPEIQAQYMSEYRLRRAEDLSKTPTWPKPKKIAKGTSKKPRVKYTDEEKTLMKLLGLKQKDIVALRAVTEEEE